MYCTAGSGTKRTLIMLIQVHVHATVWINESNTVKANVKPQLCVTMCMCVCVEMT